MRAKSLLNMTFTISKNYDLPIVWRDHGNKTAYEAARTRVFSTKLPDRYPTAVVRPKTDNHIVDSIKLAEELDVRVAIRSGGHSWAFWSIRQDAVLIDLVDYKHVEYDEATKIVTTTTSVTSSEMTAFVTERGRFVPTGHCAGVGLGGFMLQGGMGHNSRVSTQTSVAYLACNFRGAHLLNRGQSW